MSTPNAMHDKEKAPLPSLPSEQIDGHPFLHKGIVDIRSEAKDLANGINRDKNIEANEIQWLTQKITEGYKDSVEVLKQTFVEDKDEPLPSLQQVLETVLRDIDRAHLRFMMKSENWNFQLKPHCSSLDRLLSLEKHIPEPKYIPYVEEMLNLIELFYLNFKRSDMLLDPTITGYEWEFFQHESSFENDDRSDTVANRALQFKKSLPEGVHGTDMVTWVISTIVNLRKKRSIKEKKMTVFEEYGTFNRVNPVFSETIDAAYIQIQPSADKEPFRFFLGGYVDFSNEKAYPGPITGVYIGADIPNLHDDVYFGMSVSGAIPTNNGL